MDSLSLCLKPAKAKTVTFCKCIMTQILKNLQQYTLHIAECSQQSKCTGFYPFYLGKHIRRSRGIAMTIC